MQLRHNPIALLPRKMRETPGLIGKAGRQAAENEKRKKDQAACGQLKQQVAKRRVNKGCLKVSEFIMLHLSW